MSFDLDGLLQKYVGGTTAHATDAVGDDLHQVVQHAPPEVVSAGLSEAFRSDQTPPFAQMVAQLFGQANPQQRAGMLSHLIGNLGPIALGALASGGGFSSLVERFRGVPSPAVSADQVKDVTPEQVQDIAAQAEKHDPSVVDKMSSFYAQHPGLVKTLGGAALTIALAKIAQNMNR